MIARPFAPAVAAALILLALLAVSVHGHWRDSERLERICGEIEAMQTEAPALQALLRDCAGF